MKKNILKILVTIFLSFTQFSVVSCNVDEMIEDDGFVFEIYENNDGKFCCLSRYEGHETNVIIPDTYEGVSVTEINSYAFVNCNTVESVIIPNSVKQIGNLAFRECQSLKYISIPNSVEYVGEGAIESCFSLIYNEYKEGLYLGNDTNPYLLLMETANKTITTFKANDNTRFIQQNAFYECSLLEHMEIPNGVTNIGNGTFYNCSSLKSLIIPNSITAINFSAFFGCSSLETIYYTGTKDQWDAININEDENESLKAATIVYDYVKE